MGVAGSSAVAAAAPYAATRDVALGTLPGACFERVPYMRYNLTWLRPDAAPNDGIASEARDTLESARPSVSGSFDPKSGER